MVSPFLAHSTSQCKPLHRPRGYGATATWAGQWHLSKRRTWWPSPCAPRQKAKLVHTFDRRLTIAIPACCFLHATIPFVALRALPYSTSPRSLGLSALRALPFSIFVSLSQTHLIQFLRVSLACSGLQTFPYYTSHSAFPSMRLSNRITVIVASTPQVLHSILFQQFCR